MKTIIFLTSLFLSIQSYAGNVITNPATNADNTIDPSAANVTALTVNGTTGTQGALIVTNTHDWDAIDASSTTGVGLFGHSDSFYGLMSESLNESSAYFSSANSNNTKPTVLIQQIGAGAADLFQVQSSGAAVLTKVDSSGILHSSKGFQLDTSGSQPACGSSLRGMLFFVQGGTGVADKLQVCMKASGGSYSWVTK